MEVDFDCTKATYKKVTLNQFIYDYHCFPEGWEEFLHLDAVEKNINFISTQLAKEAKTQQIEPPMPDMFKAFNVKRDDIKVVIIGQDPTPQANKATGWAFSLKPGENPRTVPSVLNMLVELKWEGMNVGLLNGDLTPWLSQGVFLLNAALTVRRGQAGSHQVLWPDFTKLLLEYISKASPPSAFILWGKEAQQFARVIQKSENYIKAGGHPSPMGAVKFFGGNYFHCANEFLASRGRDPVDWQLPSVFDPMEQC